MATDRQIQRALKQFHGNRAAAARELGMSYTALHKRARGMDPPPARFYRTPARPTAATAKPRKGTAADPIDRLWAEYVDRGRPVEIRNQLAVHYGGLVATLAERVDRVTPACVECDDLEQAGHIGLLGAVEGFDPARGLKFATYAQARVRGAMLDWLRQIDSVPRGNRAAAAALDRAAEELAQQIGHTPSPQELADEVPDHVFRVGQVRQTASIDALWVETDSGRRVTLGQVLADGYRRPDTTELFDALCRGIDTEERTVLYLYHVHAVPLAVIGTILNLSESRISQIHSRAVAAIAELRDPAEFHPSRHRDRIDPRSKTA